MVVFADCTGSTRPLFPEQTGTLGLLGVGETSRWGWSRTTTIAALSALSAASSALRLGLGFRGGGLLSILQAIDGQSTLLPVPLYLQVPGVNLSLTGYMAFHTIRKNFQCL